MNHWFITQYEQILLEDGFRIEFTTDVPCHLCIYWTIHKPWVHRVSGDRRGVLQKFFAYFCFVSWTKSCQTEGGDTLFHSFTLDNWPYCQTRWFVFYGDIDGKPSPSVSPIFEKHNNYTPPPPYHWLSADHHRLRVRENNQWTQIEWGFHDPLKDHLPANTVALIIHVKDEFSGYDLGFRPKGSTSDITQRQTSLAQQWCVVGVNENIEAEAYTGNWLQTGFFLEGYVTSGGVTIFPNPVEVTPPGHEVWSTVDLSLLCPEAIGILAEITNYPYNNYSGIRKTGSTDNRTNYMAHVWALIGCNGTQLIDFYTSDSPFRNSHLYIYGYITNYASFYTNALDKSPSTPATWEHIRVKKPSNLAFFEIVKTGRLGNFKLRPLSSDWDRGGFPAPQHSWAIIPVDIAGDLEGMKMDNLVFFYQVGEGH